MAQNGLRATLFEPTWTGLVNSGRTLGKSAQNSHVKDLALTNPLYCEHFRVIFRVRYKQVILYCIQGPSRFLVATFQLATVLTRIMFSSPILRQTLGQEPSYAETNPYRAKRLWPPDFKTLSPKDQFKLERRYRRRSKLAWARPQWTKFTKIAQLGTISCEYWRKDTAEHALIESSRCRLGCTLRRLAAGERAIPSCKDD